MAGAIIEGLVGIILVTLGYLLWVKKKITLLHDYHYDKVPEGDKEIFCTISGLGIFIIGIGLLVTAVIIGITDSARSFIAMAVGFVVGLGFLIYAGLRYNR